MRKGKKCFCDHLALGMYIDAIKLIFWLKEIEVGNLPFELKEDYISLSFYISVLIKWLHEYS